MCYEEEVKSERRKKEKKERQEIRKRNIASITKAKRKKCVRRSIVGV